MRKLIVSEYRELVEARPSADVTLMILRPKRS
jgi:hypothetical protein